MKRIKSQFQRPLARARLTIDPASERRRLACLTGVVRRWASDKIAQQMRESELKRSALIRRAGLEGRDDAAHPSRGDGCKLAGGGG